MEKTSGIIRKSGNQFCIFSKKTGKKLFCDRSRKVVVKRLRQIEFFKRTKGVFPDHIILAEFSVDPQPHIVSLPNILNMFSIAGVDVPKTGKFIRFRQKSPDQFDSFRMIDIDKKKGIRAVLGIRKEDGKKVTEIQSFLFDKEKWTVKKAREWLKNHKKKTKGNLSTDLIIDDFSLIPVSNVDDEKLTIAGIRKNKDLLYIRFKLCHVGVNKNRDEFTFQELQDNYDTAKYKPVNWEHDPSQIVGVIYDSRFITEPIDAQASEDFKPYVECDAVIYKYQFPDKAQIVIDRFKKKTLAFSMETWFEQAECSVCEGKFTSANDYCEHLANRTQGSEVSRRLLGITFGGSGIVKHPADEDAVGLSVGKAHLTEADLQYYAGIFNLDDAAAILKMIVNNLKTLDIIDEEKLKNKMEMLLTTFAGLNNTGGNTVKDKIYTQADLDAAVEKARKEALAEVDEKELQNQLDEFKKKNDELTNKLEEEQKKFEALKQEFDDFKAEKEQEAVTEARLKELEDLGFDIADEEREDVVAAIKSMTDETFTVYKKSIEKLSATNNKKRKNVTQTSNASVPNLYTEEDGDFVDRFRKTFASVFSHEEVE